MAQIYSGFYIRSHSQSLPKRRVLRPCIMWSHDTTEFFLNCQHWHNLHMAFLCLILLVAQRVTLAV